jgi:hypothetical protein
LALTVDFPTPPLPLAIGMMFFTVGSIWTRFSRASTAPGGHLRVRLPRAEFLHGHFGLLLQLLADGARGRRELDRERDHAVAGLHVLDEVEGRRCRD